MLINQRPNYRVTVEVVIVKNGQILLTKRAPDCLVAPNKWCVPAGKVKYEEIPEDACVREAKEEVQLDVKVTREICVRTLQSKDSNNEMLYRLVYTYLTEITGDRDEPVINEEHSEFCWVSKEELDSDKFSSMDEKLKSVLKEVI